jgi:hypothetical protein
MECVRGYLRPAFCGGARGQARRRHPDDPTGRHYDLLLEEPAACQTWRLAEIPATGGPTVAVTLLPAHRLAWLDTEAAAVSGGRGFARRVAAGCYEHLPIAASDTAIQARVLLSGGQFSGTLEITACGLATLR